MVCQRAGIAALLPLWKEDRLAILREWWDRRFEARIVVTREGVVDRCYLSRVLDPQVANELTVAGVDACGENGEFHTLVTGGPLLRRPLLIELGEQVLRCGCWFQDVMVSATNPKCEQTTPGKRA
jgi:diphthamide synthase (EF-2-diphthine--ammonia ligase)